MNEYINDAIDKYIQKRTYPWHMPGHKRQPDVTGGADTVYSARVCGHDGDTRQGEAGRYGDIWSAIYARDFTEAKDLDDMHAPESFIADCLAEMRSVYGTYETYMLVNGTTCGIMSALHAACRQGDTVVMARNCHKSVYNAVCMLKLHPEYIVPGYIGDTVADATPSHILGDVTQSNVERVLARLRNEGRKASAVVVTSPTYEGVISDIAGIAGLVHRYGAYLIVDQAQGAHLEFMPRHVSAVRCGADIVVESLHKTMPALTQTSLLHVLTPELDTRVSRYLQIFQTSSPSYIFMQSMEKAVAYGANNPREFDAYSERLAAFAKRCASLKNIRLLSPETLQAGVLGRAVHNDEQMLSPCAGGKPIYDYDEARLVWVIRQGTTISGRRLTGVMLADMLADKYGLIAEMAAESYVICISSVADREERYDELYAAIEQIDDETELLVYDSGKGQKTEQSSHDAGNVSGVNAAIPEMAILPGEAWDMPHMTVPLAEAEGRVAAEFVYAYPPGIPVLVPGETADGRTLRRLRGMTDDGLHVSGITDGMIKVLRDKSH